MKFVRKFKLCQVYWALFDKLSTGFYRHIKLCLSFTAWKDSKTYYSTGFFLIQDVNMQQLDKICSALCTECK